MTYNFEVIAHRIQHERKKVLKMTQEELAAELGFDQPQAVGNWETGKTRPSLDSLFKLCEIFDCELGYLLGEYDTKHLDADKVFKSFGLSETVSNTLRTERNYRTGAIRVTTHDAPRDLAQALNEMFEFSDAVVIQDICSYLFHTYEGTAEIGEIEINGDAIADIFLLEIINELKEIRKKIQGGSTHG